MCAEGACVYVFVCVQRGCGVQAFAFVHGAHGGLPLGGFHTQCRSVQSACMCVGAVAAPGVCGEVPLVRSSSL